MSSLFNEDYLVSTPDYAAALESAVLPELAAKQEERTVPGKNGMPLYCSV